MEIYLDNAATSHPKPPEVVQAAVRALTDENANPGRSGHRRSVEAGRTVLAAREALAGLIHARDAFEIAFGFNCTDCLNLAIKGSLRTGDHVVSTVLEHNSVLRVLSELLRRGAIELTLISPRPDGMVDPEDIFRAIRPNTRLIAVTHASNVTGAIQPVAAVGELAQRQGIRYLIDGAQAIGSMPVDVEKLRCDLYAFPGHKGLLGPQGTGGLYIREGLELGTVREGGTGSSSESMLMPLERPERYEAGTLNLPGIAGLLAGTRHVQSRLSEIFMHERELAQALYEELAKMDSVTLYSPAREAARAGIVSMNVADCTSAEAADFLNRREICVRGGLHCAPGTHRHLGTLRRGGVRISVGHMNTFEEIDRLREAVGELAKGAC